MVKITINMQKDDEKRGVKTPGGEVVFLILLCFFWPAAHLLNLEAYIKKVFKKSK